MRESSVRILTTLSPVQFNHALRKIRGGVVPAAPAPDAVCSLRDFAGVWLATTCRSMEWLPPELRQFVFEAVLPDFLEAPLSAWADGNNPQAFIFCIGDDRWLAWHGHTGYLDLHTGNSMQKPPMPICEAVSYNLYEIFIKNLRRCREFEARNPGAADAINVGTKTPRVPTSVDG